MTGSIPESVLEEIKARTDIQDLISAYGVQIRRSGASLVACCPFHNEKTPSFHINADRGFWHCFGCGEHGDAITFVRKMEGLEFTEAVKKLADRAGVKIEFKSDPEETRRKRLYAVMSETVAFYRKCLDTLDEAQIARDYLAKRRLDTKARELFQIGYAPRGMGLLSKWAAERKIGLDELEAAGVVIAPKDETDRGYHRFSERLVFTINDRQGRAVAFSARQLVENKHSGKYVNSPETLIFKKSNVLYAFDKAGPCVSRMENREIILCEGQIDTIRLHLNGFANSVASQGTAFTEEHAQMVKRYADSAVLMYDDDSAGHKATVKVAGMLLAREMPVKVASLPGGDDPDSFLMKHPPQALKEIIDRAESIVSFQYRVERAKEDRPDSIDAVSRISKKLLETIVRCKSSILRATLSNEAAKLLGVPVSALTDDLGRIAAAPVAGRTRRSGASAPDDDVAPFPERETTKESTVVESMDAAKAEPPAALEFAFMEFLFSNALDKDLDDMLSGFIPEKTLRHPFSRKFVSAWHEGAKSGKSVMETFISALSPLEKEWFDKILVDSVKTDPCTMDNLQIMQNFVRSLWCEHIRAERGMLNAASAGEDMAERLRLTTDIKKILSAKWHAVKDMVKQMTNQGDKKWT